MKTIHYLTTIVVCGAICCLTNCKSERGSTSPPSKEALSFHEVAGLKVKLPSEPIQENMKLPPEAARLMRSFQVYKISHSGAIISVSHMEYNNPEVNLDGSADGSISQVRNVSSTTNFSSTKSNVTVSGLEGRQIFMSGMNGRHQIAMHGLVFARGSEAWQIQVIGTSSHGEELKSLSDSIFSSIVVSN